MKRQELFRHAARLYASEGYLREAVSCAEHGADAHQAGLYHEKLEAWAQAAAAYDRVERWLDAARCCERAGQLSAAAEFLLLAREPLHAAWLFVQAGSPASAEAALDQIQDPSPDQALGLNLLRAFCRGKGGGPQLGKELCRVVYQLGGPREPEPLTLQMALSLAQRLGRYDQVALLHAGQLRRGKPGAAECWSAWSKTQFDQALDLAPSSDLTQELPREN